MDNEEFTRDIHYFLGHIHSDLENIKTDISEIKEIVIPEGKDRLVEVESKVGTLEKWRNTMMVLGTGIASSVAFIGHEIISLWSKFNG